MSENVERCPGGCGARRVRLDQVSGDGRWGCGTVRERGGLARTWACDEIANLRAQLAEATTQRDAALAALREVKALFGSGEWLPASVWAVSRAVTAALAEQPATEMSPTPVAASSKTCPLGCGAEQTRYLNTFGLESATYACGTTIVGDCVTHRGERCKRAQQPATERAEAERAVVAAAMAAWRGLPKAEAPQFIALMRGLDDACIALDALAALNAGKEG